MSKKFKISFIGAGNLATNLALALDKSTHQVIEICSKNLLNAQVLANQLKTCIVKDNLDFSFSKSNIIIIAVPDKVIQEVIRNLKINPNCILIHTSGTTSLDVFSEVNTNILTGILYPLQTFNKEQSIKFSQIPILYESKSEETKKVLESLGKSISLKIKYVNSEDRKIIHLAAVFASNFTNRMLNISKDILNEKNIPLDILKLLIFQSLENCFNKTPNEALTGPAKRKDFKTINKHLEILKKKPKLKMIYELITNSILNEFNS